MPPSRRGEGGIVTLTSLRAAQTAAAAARARAAAFARFFRT